jgi:hypothetical protein
METPPHAVLVLFPDQPAAPAEAVLGGFHPCVNVRLHQAASSHFPVENRNVDVDLLKLLP